MHHRGSSKRADSRYFGERRQILKKSAGMNMNILYFSPIDWLWLKQRPQYLAVQMAKKASVTFLCQKDWKGASDLYKSLSPDEKQWYHKNTFISEGVRVVRMRLLPKERIFHPIRLFNMLVMRIKISRLNRRYNYETIILAYPPHLDYIPAKIRQKARLAYDCMDDYKSILKFAEAFIMKEEERLLKCADYLVCSSETLQNLLTQLYKEIPAQRRVIHNGVDSDLFNIYEIAQHPVNLPYMEEDASKKVCYIGTIGEWFDFGALSDAAYELGDTHFYLIGPVQSAAGTKEFENRRNIHIIGKRPKSEVPHILQKCDAAIMPFRICDTTMSVNPVKIYEYISMGIPVVATEYGEMDQFRSQIFTYREGEFTEALRKALAAPRPSDAEAYQYCLNNDWSKRAEELNDFIKP